MTALLNRKLIDIAVNKKSMLLQIFMYSILYNFAKLGNEIQKHRERHALIHHKRLMDLLGKKNIEDLVESHRKWIEETLKKKTHILERKWSESIAIGSKSFI